MAQKYILLRYISVGEKISSMDDKTLAAKLRSNLYRRDCPDTMVLGEYQLGLLDEAEQNRLHAHLARCPHCQAEFDRLVEFLTEEALPASPSPAAEEVPWTQDLGFKWRLGEARQVIIHFLSEVLSQTFSNSRQLPAGRLAYATARRGAEQSTRILGQLSLVELGHDLEVTIAAETKPDTSTTCTIIVEVDIPSRGGWPHLAKTEVTLKRKETTLAIRTTDTFGKAIFEGITSAELPLLIFTITPAP
jgi:hypothetical protein